jgi:signal transduction histidine kinase
MRPDRRFFVAATLSLFLIGLGALFLIFHDRVLHEHLEGFGADGAAWKPYGGSWELTDGIMRNNSDERGAKLITGSPFAKDYMVEADVAVLGNNGDSGLIVRARDVGKGVDSYRGFFAGLRTSDSSLILGRADYGWDEYSNGSVPTEVTVGQFYHLRVVAVGCSVAARVDLPNGESVREGVELSKCDRSGQVGLKSYESPGMWKSFRVTPANTKDLLALMDGIPLGSAKTGTLHTSYVHFNERGQLTKQAISRRLDGPITKISALQLLSPTQDTILSIHGVVTLISPITYVEDDSGGIAVLSYDAPALAIGNEVEITGPVSQSSGEFVMRNGHVKTLWSKAPALPPMITADEAATGAKDGRLVILNGQLLRKWVTQKKEMVLELEDRGEVFRAIAAKGHYDADAAGIRLQSELQVMGVVCSCPSFAGGSAFGLLISPTEDSIRIIRAASWWTPVRIGLTAAAAVILCFLLITLNHKLKEQRLLEISKERELLAHDLHDTVSQSLAGIGFQLSSAAAKIVGSDTAQHEVERARQMVKESHEELRRSITTLKTEIAAMGNLASALEACAIRTIGDGPMKVVCSSEGKMERLPLPIADCFFRIGQEAISNAVAHARASFLKIDLQHDSGHLTLRVTDNGPGFSQTENQTGFGLYGMVKRAEMIGGHFELVSGHEGTTVLLRSAVQSRLSFPELAAKLRALIMKARNTEASNDFEDDDQASYR